MIFPMFHLIEAKRFHLNGQLTEHDLWLKQKFERVYILINPLFQSQSKIVVFLIHSIIKNYVIFLILRNFIIWLTIAQILLPTFTLQNYSLID